MNDETLKKEFIKWFGKDKWKEEELLSFIETEELFLCNLMNVEPIQIIFEKLEKDNALFDAKNEYIILSSKLINDGSTNVLESFLHEFRHYYQVCMIKTNSPKFAGWKYAFEHPATNLVDYYLSPLELDAYAFAQVMMEYVYQLPYRKRQKEIQQLINEYKSQNNLFDFYERS